MQNVKSKLKFHFFLKNNCAKLFFKKTHSNLFFTLLDLKDKVISCKTSGCDSFCSNKKKKISNQAIENIINLILPILYIYDIKKVILVFESFNFKYFYKIVDCLIKKKIFIERYEIFPR
jgi:hypothetical protein